MRFVIDLDTNAIIESATNLREVTLIHAKRGDKVPFEVSFVRGGQTEPMPAGATLVFGAKQNTLYDSAAVVYEDGFTATTSATATAALTGGAVSSMTVTAGGTGYETAPLVTIAAPAASVTATATTAISAGAVTGATVGVGGSYYPSAPVVTIAEPPAFVTATASATISAGEVSAVAVLIGGGYYNATPSVTFSAPPAVTTATAAASLSADATVEWIAPVKGGGYYPSAPTVTVAAPPTPRRATGWVSVEPSGFGGDYYLDLAGINDGGSGYSTVPTVTVVNKPGDTTGADGAVEAVISNGKVTALVVTNQGNGLYTKRPDILIDLPTVSTATATATISNGIVTGYTVTDPGAGYMAAPAVIVDAPPSPVTATGTATLTAGVVTAVTVTDGGSGYTSPPTVSISAPAGTRTQATATATVSGGAVTAITITSAGSGYITAPAAVIAAPPAPTQATATAVMSSGVVTGLDITSAGSGYTATPAVTIEESPLKYIASPSFNTTELAALFLIDGNTGNDPLYKDLMGEFTWQATDALPSTTKTFTIRVHNDVVRDDEPSPTPLPGPIGYTAPQNVTYATVTTSETGTNNDITATAISPGQSAVRLIIGSSSALAIEVTGDDVICHVDTGVTTAAEVISAVNAHTIASTMLHLENAPGNDGSGVCWPSGPHELVGGTSPATEAPPYIRVADGLLYIQNSAGTWLESPLYTLGTAP